MGRENGHAMGLGFVQAYLDLLEAHGARPELVDHPTEQVPREDDAWDIEDVLSHERQAHILDTRAGFLACEVDRLTVLIASKQKEMAGIHVALREVKEQLRGRMTDEQLQRFDATALCIAFRVSYKALKRYEKTLRKQKRETVMHMEQCIKLAKQHISTTPSDDDAAI